MIVSRRFINHPAKDINRQIMKASVLLKALEAYGDLDVCVIKETGPMAYNDADHHKAVDAKVFAIMDNKIIIAEKEIRID